VREQERERERERETGDEDGDEMAVKRKEGKKRAGRGK